MTLAMLTAFRDAAFWWGGVWAAFTLLDAGLYVLWRRCRRNRERRERRRRREETE